MLDAPQAERNSSLGSWHVLSDSLIEGILSFLGEKELMTCMAVSRVFYVFAEEEDRWKTLVIKRYGGNFKWKGNWRRTALLPPNKKVTEPYTRLKPRGYSPAKYERRRFRSTVSLDRWATLEKQGVDRRSNLSLEEFIEEYDKKCKPVIITDIVKNWPAYSRWTKEGLMKTYGDCLFKTDEVDFKCREKLYMTFEDYMSYFEDNHDEDPIYLFDDKFNNRDRVKDLLHDYQVPEYFKGDFFEYLEEERPPFRWIAIGPPRSGSAFHIDPYRTSAWNGLISGRKRWALYPYSQYPPGCDFDFDEDGNFDMDAPDPVKWYLDTYANLPPNRKPIECILEEGELIYVPYGWWHMVLNLTETVAVTQNFCNSQNFDIVCAEIEFDDDDFYEEFQERIENYVPDVKWPNNRGKGPYKK